jgi:hypothetical protein
LRFFLPLKQHKLAILHSREKHLCGGKGTSTDHVFASYSSHSLEISGLNVPNVHIGVHYKSGVMEEYGLNWSGETFNKPMLVLLIVIL